MMGKPEKEPEPEEEVPMEEMSEIDQLALQINHKTDESLESTRRMLTMCEASKEAGITTLVNLDEQGEILDKFNEDMDEIGRDMKEAEEALQGMEKFCGLCVLPWNKPKPVEDEFAWAWKEDGQVNNSGPPRAPPSGDQAMISGDYITRITKDDREEEMERNVDEVSNIVRNLHYMANDMGNEIESQNRLITTIGGKAGSNQLRIKAANSRANKLM